jgi:tRNA-dihydrouridine synthase
MKQNFWKQLPKPFFALAPMEDVTDITFRHVIAKAARPDVFFTEFTNTKSFNNEEGKESMRGRLMFTQDEGPIVAHVWGDNPDDFKTMAIGVAQMGYDGLDINMGCPAPNVFKHGRGAGLILRPDVAAEIIQAAKAGGIPVSVKTRLGHARVDEYKAWLTHLLKQDIANLSIHLRTKVEMSKAKAHWELIPDILKLRDEIAPDTCITINGDIMDYQMGMELATKYKVDGIMIGRGVFHNPYAFEKEAIEHSSQELLDLFQDHLKFYKHFTAIEPKLSKPLHRFFKIYIRDFKGAHDLRVDLMATKTVEDIEEVLKNYKKSASHED